DHWYERHVRDLVAREGIADVLRAERSQVHDACSTDERPDEAYHEVDGMVRGQNAQVAHARPERVKSRQRDALLEIVFVCEHASFRLASGAGGIHNAGWMLSVPWHEARLAFALEILPGVRGGEIFFRRRFGHEHRLNPQVLETGTGHSRTP